MTFFVDRLLAISALCVVLLLADVASAVEEVFEDTNYFGIRGSISEGTALVGQRFGGTSGNGDVQVFKMTEGGWGHSACLADVLAGEGVVLATDADFGAGALAIDGNTAIAAAYRNEVDGVSEAGSVFLFTHSEGTWSYDAQWNEPGATAPTASAQFGIAGDLDGDQALILASGTSMAYVYNRSGSTWDGGTALAGGNLNAPGAAAIDNGVAVVGTFLGDGHLDIWRYGGETWNYEGAIANPGSDNLFGAAVDVSGDTIVVSAHGQTVNGQAAAGAVHVYQYNGQSWGPPQTIENPEPIADDVFGCSVAIENDRLIVGAPRCDVVTVGDANRDGAIDRLDAAILAMYWGQSEATWAMGDFNWDRKVDAKDASILAANWNPSGNEKVINDTGAAYVFQRTDSTWNLEPVEKRMIADPIAGQWFGEVVGLDEPSLLIGGSGRATVDPIGQGVVQLNAFIPGDANLDDVVDEEDAAILASHWGEADATWARGDFDEDGMVGPTDASILAANWGTDGGEPAPAAAVPEPNTIVLLIGALLGLATLRR